MPEEDLDMLTVGLSPMLSLYIRSIIDGKNALSLRAGYFSAEEEEELKELIEKTLPKARRTEKTEKIEKVEKTENKEGGVKMAEETAHTPEEIVSEKLGVDIEAVIYFEEYVKGLTKEEYTEEAKKLPENVVLDTFYYVYTEKELPFQKMERMYATDIEDLRNYILAKYQEKPNKDLTDFVDKVHEKIEEEFSKESKNEETPAKEKASTMSHEEYTKKEDVLREAIIGKMAQQLGIEPKVLKPLIRTDVANADLLEACAFIKHSVEQNGQEYTLGKLAEAHAKHHPGSKDNPFDLKNLSPEEKKELAAKAEETKNAGKVIAEDKIEKRRQEIKEIAEKYRTEMGQHVGENIKEIKSKIEELKSQQEELLAGRDDIKSELEKATKELEELQKEYEESTKGVQEDIDLHDEKISSIEKNSKALIKSEKKGRFARFISKLAEKFGFANEKKSKEDINAVLDGEKEAPKNKGFFETIGEAVQETRKDTKDNISSIKEAKGEKIAELAEKKEKLEAQLAEAQAKLDDKESEIAKIRDSQQGKDDKILSQVKDAEMEIESWEKEIKYLEKLQERIANLSDRKAYRLSQRGRDKDDGMDR
jgi:hypothetical protein